MAELALGVLGVVPLIGVTIKSYQQLSSKAKTFRHCSSAVLRLYKQLRIQRRIFENECQLLLHNSLRNDPAVEEMMADPDNSAWKGRSRDKELKAALKNNYDSCVGLIEDINEAIQHLRNALDCFGVVKTHQRPDECLKKTWRRIGDGLKISLNKSDYEAKLNDLREGNCTLKTLREQLHRLQKPSKIVALKEMKPVPANWSTIRGASKTLHEVLVEAWSCNQTRHSRHSVKLFLEAEMVDNDAELHIAILCHGQDQMTGQADLFQLQVRSKLMTLMSSENKGATRLRKRLKSLRFEQGNAKENVVQIDPTQSYLVAKDDSLNLRGSTDICQEFTSHRCQQERDTEKHVLGYLEAISGERYKHQFFTSSRFSKPNFLNSTAGANNLIPMHMILGETTNNLFSIVDKLKMAKALVLAVLKFHATPWLGESWRLQDLAFFHYCEDLSRSLQTLHVGVEFDQRSKRHATGIVMEDIHMTSGHNTLSQVSEDDRLFCGIDNMALHCLGVALLQIDRMKSLEPADVLSVRKMARTSSSLGPKYKEITEKCLRCDFGYGTDLNNTKLQEAVHGSLVGVLESMISVLDINDDEDNP